MKRRYLGMTLVGAAVVAVALAWWLRSMMVPSTAVSGDLPAACRDVTFETVAYVVCEIDPRAYDVGLFYADRQGKAFGSIETFDEAMQAAGTPVLLAMNAGMYHENLDPVGLLVENGRVVAPLNLADDKGNFFLKPNGVFFIGGDGKAGILESHAFAEAKPDVEFATQSGPMLVVEGQMHPRFEPDGKSRYTRNGVGVRDDNTIVLAISRSEVSLGSFARLFRDAPACKNALFFDGAVSALSNGGKVIVGGGYPAGPIIAVTTKRAGGS